MAGFSIRLSSWESGASGGFGLGFRVKGLRADASQLW